MRRGRPAQHRRGKAWFEVHLSRRYGSSFVSSVIAIRLPPLIPHNLFVALQRFELVPNGKRAEQSSNVATLETKGKCGVDSEQNT